MLFRSVRSRLSTRRPAVRASGGLGASSSSPRVRISTRAHTFPPGIIPTSEPASRRPRVDRPRGLRSRALAEEAHQQSFERVDLLRERLGVPCIPLASAGVHAPASPRGAHPPSDPASCSGARRCTPPPCSHRSRRRRERRAARPGTPRTARASCGTAGAQARQRMRDGAEELEREDALGHTPS
mgnify:CR=1 FL=1